MYEDLLGAIQRHNALLQEQNNFQQSISIQLGVIMSAVSDLRDKIAEVATNVRDKITALEAANATAQQAAADAMAAAGASEAAKAALQAEFDARLKGPLGDDPAIRSADLEPHRRTDAFRLRQCQRERYIHARLASVLVRLFWGCTECSLT